jgi:hypothetical protein
MVKIILEKSPPLLHPHSTHTQKIKALGSRKADVSEASPNPV